MGEEGRALVSTIRWDNKTAAGREGEKDGTDLAENVAEGETRYKEKTQKNKVCLVHTPEKESGTSHWHRHPALGPPTPFTSHLAENVAVAEYDAENVALPSTRHPHKPHCTQRIHAAEAQGTAQSRVQGKGLQGWPNLEVIVTVCDRDGVSVTVVVAEEDGVTEKVGVTELDAEKVGVEEKDAEKVADAENVAELDADTEYVAELEADPENEAEKVAVAEELSNRPKQ